MARERNSAPKKRRWWHTIADAYRITQRTYKWLPWAMLGLALVGVAVAVIPAILTGRWIFWPLMGIMLTATLPLLLLVQLVRRASYAQLDGIPGATSAVLDNLGRGWNVQTEPVRFNARTQDFVFRALGRAGVVVVSEGPRSRVRKLVDDERKAIKRVAPNAPVHVVMVGHDQGQVPLSKLERTMKKLPKSISNQEVAALARRLEAINPNNIPIPKGIDPTNTRMNRRALRGN